MPANAQMPKKVAADATTTEKTGSKLRARRKIGIKGIDAKVTATSIDMMIAKATTYEATLRRMLIVMVTWQPPNETQDQRPRAL